MSAWQAAAACECASTRAQMWAACTRKRDAKKDWERGQMERKSKAKKTNSNCETQLNCVLCAFACCKMRQTNSTAHTHTISLFCSSTLLPFSPPLSHTLSTRIVLSWLQKHLKRFSNGFKRLPPHLTRPVHYCPLAATTVHFPTNSAPLSFIKTINDITKFCDKNKKKWYSAFWRPKNFSN